MAYARLGHDFTKSGATSWRATINTKADGLPTAGKLSFYAVASDAKGVKSKSKVGSLTITRCDSEATIAGGLPGSVFTFSDTWRVPWSFNITDVDGLKTVRVSYVLRNAAGVTFLTGSVYLTNTEGDTWSGYSASFDAYPYSYQWDTAAYTVTTTDDYGGKTSFSKAENFLLHLP